MKPAHKSSAKAGGPASIGSKSVTPRQRAYPLGATEEVHTEVGKLAERVASRIEGDIIRGGWQIGTLLGSEAELVQRHSVSRWVMREAIGILEREGLVTSKRGRNGGLVVTAPALESVGSSIRHFFNAARVSHADVMQCREVLEQLALSLATQRLDADGIVRLRQTCALALNAPSDARGLAALNLVKELFQATNNPALEVFCFSLAQVTLDQLLRSHLTAQQIADGLLAALEQRAQQVEAMVAFDPDRAEQLVRGHLRTISAMLEVSDPKAKAARGVALGLHIRHLDADNGWALGRKGTRPRLTELVAAALEDQLASDDLCVGTVLGSEADLMSRFNVSRSVLREAIRPLERMGIVEMSRGRGHGLVVSEPNPSAIIRSAALYLRFAKVDEMACEDIERTIEIAVASSLAGAQPQVRLAVATKLHSLVQPATPETWRSLEEQAKGFGLTLAEASPNPVLTFFLRTLVEILRFRKSPPFPGEKLAAVAQALKKQVQLVATAIEQGDQPMARHHVIEMWRVGRRIAFSNASGAA